MKKYTAALSLVVVGLLMSAGVGCSFENAFPLSAHCTDDDDCTGNNVCTLGLCQSRGGKVDPQADVGGGQDVYVEDSGPGDRLDGGDSLRDVGAPELDVHHTPDTEHGDVEASVDVVEQIDVVEPVDVPFVPECDEGIIQQCRDAQQVCLSTYRVCRNGKWGACEGIHKASNDSLDGSRPDENVNLTDLDKIEHVDCVLPTQDGMTYIPAGVFYRGSPDAGWAYADEQPAREIYLTPYFIDTHEVSREDYKKCVDDQGCEVPSGSNNNCSTQLGGNANLNRPVACVSFKRARTYCEKQGKRLATEAEWEKAARGPAVRGPVDHAEQTNPRRAFPWGDDYQQIGSKYANIRSQKTAARCYSGRYGYNDGPCLEDVDETGRSAGQSYYGLYHMTGNVGEYVRDRYEAGYYENSPNVNPVNQVSEGVQHSPVVRGGSFSEGTIEGRVSHRSISGGNYSPVDQIGIRCVKDAP